MKNILTTLILSIAFFLPVFAQNNTFPTTGNVGIGTTSPETNLDIKGGLSVGGANPKSGINNFRNYIQIKAPDDAALIYNPGEETELMFGFHNNGNFYWGTGTNYVMTLSKNGAAKIYNSLSVGGNLKTGSKLSVNGKISAKEVEVTIANWPDYVFTKEYKLQSLTEVKAFIEKHQHLPDMPDKNRVTEEGLNLGEMNRKLLEKVEELTLHLIDVSARVDSLSAENAILKREIPQ